MIAQVTHPFFEQFPQLQPYVGENYENGKTKHLLIVGESHYLPTEKHLAPEAWYNHMSQTNFTQKELGYIETANLIQEARGSITHLPYRIYMHIAKELNALGLGYTNYTDALSHIMYMNYFQRPAEKPHESIQVAEIDKQMAESVMRAVVQDYKPELIIIVSKLANNNQAGKLFHEMGIPVETTPHPGCRWWNTKTGKYGNRRGRDVFCDFLKKHDWIQTL
ncbi:MAG: hypothetical protein FWF96_04390 [Kiritimatiellaeota bacterium]|nr:hypothetical protein [Kiritimatiellota bacterium]